jgi:hypothetical protein
MPQSLHAKVGDIASYENATIAQTARSLIYLGLQTYARMAEMLKAQKSFVAPIEFLLTTELVGMMANKEAEQFIAREREERIRRSEQRKREEADRQAAARLRAEAEAEAAGYYGAEVSTEWREVAS